MTIQRDNILTEIQSLRAELGRLLNGMDYCFDWKPQEGEWSAREVLYHLVDTPSGGIHLAVLGVLEGRLREFSVTADLTNLTPGRRETDVGEAMGEMEAVLTGLETALDLATDADLKDKLVAVLSVTRATNQERTPQDLLEGLFLRHWKEHLGQLAALRDMLGVD